ncbi:MAG: Peptidase fungalysin [Pedosphaera sp.]|nr:Peptidase fungalysin [Pedosphaera sp.]
MGRIRRAFAVQQSGRKSAAFWEWFGLSLKNKSMRFALTKAGIHYVWMKRSAKNLWRVRLAGALFLMLSLTNVFAAVPPSLPELPNFDRRTQTRTPPSPEHLAAVTQLKAKLPETRVDVDEALGTAKWVRASRGFLSGSNGTGRSISPQTLAAFSASDPDRATKAFLAEHRGIFGHGPEALTGARVKRQFTTAHNGLRTVVWEQQLDNIPLFETLLVSHTTKNGELVDISSYFLPDPAGAANAENHNRAALQAKPTVTAPQAVAYAAQNLGEALGVDKVQAINAEAEGAEKHQRFKAGPLLGDSDARLVWLPMNRGALRLCWQVILMSRVRNEMFLILIDARTGAALVRHSLTENISDASYRVFTTESPTPFCPGYATPNSTQPATVARVLVVTNAYDTTASPNGWINDGDNETVGNNVDAHLDHNADGQPDVPRPRGLPFRVFDPALDLTQDPLMNTNAAVVNLFFWNNWMHDKLYEFGFTEAAGNFQINNFGRGGQSNDLVLADAQVGTDYQNANNANFSTPPDGLPGRMRMYIFNGPTPNRDGCLDAQVITHEYTHGLSNRQVGGGVGITALQSRGLGEGWSDFYSLALLSKPGDDVNGNYPEGGYVAYHLSGLNENYYYGIRRYPYSTDMTKNPQTFKDIDPGQADAHTGIPRNPAVMNVPSEIHNQGEIWCVALWDARANLINKYGYAVGNHLIIQLLTDGMNLTPANPDFVEARDAIIQADIVDNGGANFHELWVAFAKRGLGYNAIAPASSTTSGVTESFVVPGDNLLVNPRVDIIASGRASGPFAPTSQSYVLSNAGTNSISWTAGADVTWLDFSVTNGVLAANGGSTNILISINATANSLQVGEYSGTITFSNLTSAAGQTQEVALSVSPRRLDYFSLTNDPGWSRQGEWAFGKPAGQGGVAHGNPDPTSGSTGTNVFGVNLNGDYATTVGGPYYLTLGPLNLTNSAHVMLLFNRWLNTDFQPYTFATVDVSNDGTNWAPVFDNGTTQIADSNWVTCAYNISAVADNQPTVYVRWGYEIALGSFAYSGWNIDNIEFLGLSQLTMSLPASAMESDGVLAGQGHVSVPIAPTANVIVNLTSSDTSQITVPATVTILAGQSNANFDVTMVDNLILDGTRQVAVIASAPGCSGVTNQMLIFDNETANLAVALPASATEGDAPIAVTISANAAPANNIIISLTSSDTNSLQVPATVILPAGQTSVFLNATIMDDLLINGDRSVTVTAHVAGWSNGISTITIHDNESTNLSLSLPPQARASNGVLTNAGRVWIYGIPTTNVAVSLSSTNTSNLTLPAVTILAGQTSAVFNVTLVEGGPPYGTMPVLVNASAPGFVGSQATITLIDDQTPPAPRHPAPLNLSTNNPVTVGLSWSPGFGEGTELLANGNFESGNLSGWIVSTNAKGICVINDGTVMPHSLDAPTPPFAGGDSALASQSGAGGLSVLRQDVVLPTNAATIVLGWDDRIRNFDVAFATNQQFSVEVRDTNDVTLAVVFSTQAGNTLLNDWAHHSTDLSAYRGQKIRLAFIINAAGSYLDVHLDNISLRAANLPPITYDVYLGTNAVPGPAEFLGSTTNTYWTLPILTPLTTYYWQVVARRGNQTAGPIWQFSALSLLSVTNVSLLEGNSGTTNAVFNVQLTGASAQTVTVHFATADGSAFAPGDYAATNGTLVFNPGDTNQTVSVQVNGNTVNEPNKVFLLTFSNPVNALLVNTQATGTILNDDNAPPSLAAIADQIVNELTTLTFTNSATDADLPNETLTFTLDPGAPTGASVNPSTGVFSWTPSEAQGPGVYGITVRVTDNSAPPLSDAKSFNVTVNEVNSPPVLAPIANRTVHAGSTVSFTAIATDSDLPTNTITFSLDAGAPASASVGSSSGIFTWTTGAANIGTTNYITLRVTDNGVPSLSNAQTFSVVVMTRPQIVSISLVGSQIGLTWNAITGQTYRVQYEDNLTNSWSALSGDVTASVPLASKIDPAPLVQHRFYRILVYP